MGKKSKKAKAPAAAVEASPRTGHKKKKIQKGQPKQKLTGEVLKNAVFALGGDRNDLDLLETLPQVEDEEEVLEDEDVTAGVSENFSQVARKELEVFIKNLGLDKKFQNIAEADVPSAPMEDEDDDDEEAWEEDDQEEEDEEQVQVEVISSTSPLEEAGEESEEPSDEDEPVAASKKKTGSEFHFLKDKSPRSQCLAKFGDKWFETLEISEEAEGPAPEYWMPKVEKYATGLMEAEVENFKARRSRGGLMKSEENWIQTVLQSGALGDKISAYTVMLQENPVPNLSALSTLIDMVSLKSRRPCILAIEALKDVFISHLLAPERKLKVFRDQPFSALTQISGGNRDTRDRCLLLWWFEDQLKAAYTRFLKALDEVAKDTIEKTKIQAMSTVLELLKANPECEDVLLAKLINKLGDPSRSIAAKAMHLLGKLLEEHPLMKEIVIKEVERILYRPNVSSKAQYYGICFLSTILLEAEEFPLANKLIRIYFGFFKGSVKKGEIDTKLMSALLTGVNRAFPYSKLDTHLLDDQIQIMFKVVNLSAFNTSIQALMLLYQIMGHGESCSDRFYTTLYKKLQDAKLENSSKHTLFINLLYKAMKHDSSVPRVRAFVKRILQMCQYFPPHLVCGCLFLVSEVVRGRPDVSLAPGQSGDVLAKFQDDGEENYQDVKSDDEDSTQEDMSSEAEEVEEVKPEVKDEPTKSWVHLEHLKANVIRRKVVGYDANHRNPMYCGAEHAVFWELDHLATHFHPTVALFAQNILEGVPIKYSGDPIQDFTLIRFLDRFVFRNPKKDPLKSRPKTVLAKRGQYVAQGVKSIAPDSKEYLHREMNAVPEDERFLYKFFSEKAAKKTVAEDSDASSVTSEDFNRYMDKISAEMGADDDGLDFANGLGDLKTLDSDDDEEDDFEDMDMDPELEGEDDSEDNFEALEDMDDSESDAAGGGDTEDSFDEEAFGEEDEDLPAKNPAMAKLGKKALAKFKMPKSGDLTSLLASAEEFADMIDENQDDDADQGGSEAVSTVKDKAGKKQLKWEKTRNEDKSKWKQKKKQFGQPQKKRR